MNGQVVPSQVLNVFNNGRSDRWLKVTFTRRLAGRGGNNVGTIHCTPNHCFWTPDKNDYTPASELRVGNLVNLLRSDTDLTPVQHAILPPTATHYKPLLVSQRVVAIEEYIAPRANRYDIETETHNYFANGVLTHNSNSRVGLLKVDGEWQFVAGSHKTARKQIDPEGRESVYWSPLQDFNVLRMLTDMCNEANDIILFGELYGPGVQDLDYGIPAGDIGWRMFDITANGEYLDWGLIAFLSMHYDVPTVPLLYSGPFKRELIDELTCGPTTVVSGTEIKSKFKGREGIVITPLVEETCSIGRLILKSVSADYLDRKGAEDNGDI